MADKYIPVTDLLDLSVWTKSSVAVKALEGKVSYCDLNRKFRNDVTINNRMYLNGEAEHYIIHGNLGYKWAETEEEIEHSLRDLERRAYTMLSTVSGVRKALKSRDQISFNDVAAYRRAKNMTAETLIKRVKEAYPSCPLDTPTLSKIETGKVLPNHDTMVAIAEVLGVGVVKLFGPSALVI